MIKAITWYLMHLFMIRNLSYNINIQAKAYFEIKYTDSAILPITISLEY